MKKMAAGLSIERRWFVEMDGRAQGPFTLAQVQDIARLKRITPMTRIFLEGDVRWRLMNEFDEFKIAPESSSTSSQNREWVVLKRKTLKEAELSQNKFDQIGPFTVDEIVEQIKTGDLSYNDYAWKKGFQRWAKLESLPDFNHTLKKPTPSIPDAPPIAIAFLNEPKLDIDPEEQNELDHFTATNSKPLKREPETTKSSEKAKKLEAAPSEEKPVGGTKKSVRAFEEEINKQSESDEVTAKKVVSEPRPSGRLKIVRVVLAATATLVVTAVAYDFITENYGPQPSAETSSAVAVQQPPTDSQFPVAAPAAPIEQPPEVQPGSPTYASSLPKKGIVSKPPAKQIYSKADYEMPASPRLDFDVIRPVSIGQIILSTNAPVNYPIEVKITGKSGQILRHASYSQVLRVQRQGGEVPSVQLSALKLPFGTYTVQAKFNELTKQKTFFYGVRDAKFEKALTAHLKKISTQQILEKKMVFYFLRDLESKAKKLEVQRAKAAKNKAGWVKAYSAWRKDVRKATSKSFAGLKGVGPRDIAYPEEIAKARELSQSLLKQGEELNVAIVQNRTLASAGMGPILIAIRDFKKQVGTLSRY